MKIESLVFRWKEARLSFKATNEKILGIMIVDQSFLGWQDQHRYFEMV